MEKNAEVKIGGIKCDTVGCGYRDDTVTFEQYKDYVGRPCPKCGANLLTKKDYKACVTLVRIANLLNKLPASKSKESFSMTFEFNGKDDPKLKDFKKIS